eukprot:CAMPEP_0183312858 /NCGR_PEP_ID=MMETSP0160_2-20130417/43310_1 /TAXON_ID=2839 ORGANISM="Odontella Sinensis, Strain Grunow 1884" /NCGR_SAMPLE_ID=MMETSP0160_2 /ASSEMBLY_ACC=CAM_ASM_000250 /LENGTH=115 /DNA_ID=CAMNT_0025477801 /DNA_START=16 /DNA_END=360 /DNA_ORIENTATION=-
MAAYQNPFLRKAPVKRTIENIQHHSEKLLPESLSSLSEQSKHIDEVFAHCTNEFMNARTQSDRDAIEGQTMTYLLDIMKTVENGIRDLAETIEKCYEFQDEMVSEDFSKKMESLR